MSILDSLSLKWLLILNMRKRLNSEMKKIWKKPDKNWNGKTIITS
jgi:hypothetical protein